MATVQWFPGHMTKTKRLIKDNMKRIDVVIEVLDARAPLSSQNPLLQSITHSKPRLLVLNKDDLADKTATSLWIKHFLEQKKSLPVRVSGILRKKMLAIEWGCRELCKDASWLSRRPVRALIVGIPNVGKSTIINALSKTKKAETGAKPGLTRDLRCIPINNKLEIFDTPGLLWHKFEDPLVGIILASLGAIKETILPNEEVIGNLLAYMAKRYSHALSMQYKLKELPSISHELIVMVGQKRGCLLSGGSVDVSRTCQMILKDLREGKFGQISLEWPDGKGWDNVYKSHVSPS